MTLAPPTIADIDACYRQPFLDLLFQAQEVHRAHHPRNVIQLATLSNIKSGNCGEDCGYCSQSARYDTGVAISGLPSEEEIREQARAAKSRGSSRFCMGAAWRTPPTRDFPKVLALVRAVADEGMEACVTLGMLNAEQARALKDAGLTAYNHNIDTAPSHYANVVTTRTMADRIETLGHVGDAGLQICCGGILGLGESVEQRIEFIETLCHLPHPPESVPINCLTPIAGTPLADQPPVDPIDLVRTVATTRIFLPGCKVRLSAGRAQLSDEAQALCFLAGANSIFAGEALLTTPNVEADQDARLLEKLGLQPAQPAGHQQTPVSAR
ncbi:MAG: biotin synthase BioB [Vampirovibrionales bacterium]|nr:biotin synthase BioB [Vampirovibrionales bacterium]